MIEIIQSSTAMVCTMCVLLTPGMKYFFMGDQTKLGRESFCFENNGRKNDGVMVSYLAGKVVYRIGPNIVDCRESRRMTPCVGSEKECALQY